MRSTIINSFQETGSPASHTRYYEFGSYRLDALCSVLYRDGVPVSLTPKTFETLLILVQNRHRIVCREELIQAIWPDVNVDAGNLTQNIYILRKTLEHESGQRYILTVPGRGYRFVGDLLEDDEASIPPANLAPQEKVPDVPFVTLTNGAVISSDVLHHESGRRLWVSAAVAASLCLLAVAAWWGISRSFRNHPVLPPHSRFVTSLPGIATEPTLSPDGSRIAFCWNGESGTNYDIYVKSVDSETYTRLTSHPGVDTSPAWSPDGRFIAFLRLTPTEGGVFIVPVSGGPERRVGSVYTDRLGIKARHLDWSPDGKSLVVDDKGGPQESVSLFLLSVATGERKRLTSAPRRSSSDLAPRFSPDGTQIAFIRSASANVRDVYVVPASGGDPRPVTSDARWIGDLDWTSEGRAIIFSSDRSGIPSLWGVLSIASKRVAKPVRVSPSGEDAAYLSVYKHRAGKPGADKHGARIAYSRPSVNSGIWKLDLSRIGNADGGWTKLMGSAWEVSAPEYSRDGRKFLYRIDAPGNRQFGISDSDGRNQVALKSIGSPHSVDWSPDGRLLTFDMHQNGHFGIFVATFAGGSARQLATAEADDEYPRWSPDGKYIYFSSNRTGHWQIWRVSAAGGPAAQVTWQGGYGGRVSPDGKTLYYSKHQSLPGVWSVPTSGGDETLVFNDVKPEHWGLWTVGADGIYFVDNGEPGSRPPASIKFFSFSTRQVTVLATAPKPAMLTGSFNLSLSASGHSLVLPLMDQASSDIVLVDNFR